MGALDRFEEKIEGVMRLPFSWLGKQEIKAVDIAQAIRNAMNDNAAVITENRTLAPNQFEVRLSKEDFSRFAGANLLEVLTDEMADEATKHAQTQNYALAGPASVDLIEDESLEPGRLQLTAAVKRGAIAPAVGANLYSYPMIVVGENRYVLTAPQVIIGRGTGSDIIVPDDPAVSRQHLKLEKTKSGVIATDLNSANGMFVENNRVGAATLVDGNTITIGSTIIRFWEAQEEEGSGA